MRPWTHPGSSGKYFEAVRSNREVTGKQWGISGNEEWSWWTDKCCGLEKNQQWLALAGVSLFMPLCLSFGAPMIITQPYWSRAWNGCMLLAYFVGNSCGGYCYISWNGWCKGRCYSGTTVPMHLSFGNRPACKACLTPETHCLLLHMAVSHWFPRGFHTGALLASAAISLFFDT